MRGFCGWFSGRPDHEGERHLHRMLAANQSAVSNVETALGQHNGIAVFGTVAPPSLVETDGFFLVIAGHPRLCSGSRRSADPKQLAQALRARGKDALTSMGGDFALATWDSRTRRGLLAVDRVGAHQLVHARTADGLVFGTSLDMLGGHPAIRRELSSQGLFDYLYYHVCPGPETIFNEMSRLAPGHCLEFGEGFEGSPRAYWSMRFTEGRDQSVKALEDEFINLLEGAVREASEGPSCGAFLSGGTDSSTVSGMLGRVSVAPAKTFSIGFDVPGFDETEFARIAAKHFGSEHHEYYVTPADVVTSLPSIAASYDQPFGNASAVPTFHCARFARQHGVSRLLAGDGGDELFGGNERYAKQHLLGLYQRVPSALRRSVIEPMLQSSPWLEKVPPLRKLRSYVEQAKPAMPKRYESYNLLQHLGIEDVLTTDFLASVDQNHPSRLMAQEHARYADASLVNQMMGIDLRFILADGDLPKVSHMCNLAGIDVAFPLLDDRLIEFSRGLPSELKLRGTHLRWFFKRALREFLPPAVITKKKHGFGLPVGHWLIQHRPLYDLAVDSIKLLEPRGIVRPQFISELLDTKLREHPGYYGTMVWVLMMLGLWLDSRKL
jgi:asparagine synthase (glutamine-hydrolysing)